MINPPQAQIPPIKRAQMDARSNPAERSHSYANGDARGEFPEPYGPYDSLPHDCACDDHGNCRTNRP